jgi:hypothetical protein
MAIVVTKVDRTAQACAKAFADLGVATVHEAQVLDCYRVLHDVEQQFD